MKYRITHTYSVPKDGNTPQENEDAWAVSADHSLVVLSDGASEGMYSREWAQYLCTHLSTPPYQIITPALLKDLGNSFQSGLEKKEVPWYVENKMRETGAAATLLYLHHHKKIIKQWWEVGGTGDTCIILFQDKKLVWSWPLEKGEEFDTSPELVYNLFQKNGQLKSRTVPLPRGKSTLILATDALAEAIISGKTATIPVLKTNEAFHDWIDTLRKDHILKNDDTTMVLMEIEN